MMIFLTFNDAPTGIYSSQVIDVVRFFREQKGVSIRLVSFISLRGFFKARKKIKAQLSDALVLPMFPKLSNWKKNRLLLQLLCLFLRPQILIARGIIAANLAFSVKSALRKVIYDGRGAIAAEWTEYKVVTDSALLSEVAILESRAINESDGQIAVSEKLIDWWVREYHFKIKKTFVIPCTINEVFENLEFTPSKVEAARLKLGYSERDYVFVYSGSVASWQGFSLLERFAIPLLSGSATIKFLFLSAQDEKIKQIQDRFPAQVKVHICPPSEVPEYLLAGNFGLLIREQSVTNEVASPVKFAEYLACGLPVIISRGIGDYSDFVVKNKCGFLAQDFAAENLPSFEERKKFRAIALTAFTKINFKHSYLSLIQ
jgi:glycosyltransferase involved in cell wall biosynthesis